MKFLNSVAAFGSLCGLLIVTGCAQKDTRFVAIDRDVKDSIRTTEVVIEAPKEAITAQYDATSIGSSVHWAGALIDLAVNSARQSSAESDAKALQDLVKTIPIKVRLTEKLRPVLAKQAWMNATVVRDVKELEEKDRKALIKESPADAIMDIKFTYHLNPNFTLLEGNIYASMYATKDLKDGVKQGTQIYRTEVSSVREVPNANKDRKINCDCWGANNAENLRSALTGIIDELSEQLEFRLNYAHLDMTQNG